MLVLELAGYGLLSSLVRRFLEDLTKLSVGRVADVEISSISSLQLAHQLVYPQPHVTAAFHRGGLWGHRAEMRSE